MGPFDLRGSCLLGWRGMAAAAARNPGRSSSAGPGRWWTPGSEEALRALPDHRLAKGERLGVEKGRLAVPR